MRRPWADEAIHPNFVDALDLLASGRRATDLARDLGISSQTIYLWRHQEQIARAWSPA